MVHFPVGRRLDRQSEIVTYTSSNAVELSDSRSIAYLATQELDTRLVGRLHKNAQWETRCHANFEGIYRVQSAPNTRRCIENETGVCCESFTSAYEPIAQSPCLCHVRQ